MAEAVEKQRLNITISKENLEWIEENIENNRFASRSHALDYAVTVLREIDASQKAGGKRILGVIEHGTRMSAQDRAAANLGPGDVRKEPRFRF